MIPPTGLGEPTLILNVSTGSGNNFETLRDSHLRSQEQGFARNSGYTTSG